MEKEKAYQVEKKALVDLVSRTVREVEGVHAIKRGLFGKHIKIKETEEGMFISLGIIIRKGVSIPLVVEKVQRGLLEEVKIVLGAPVKKINITVKGIKFSP